MLALLVLVLVKTSSQQPRVPDNTYQSCLEKLDRGNCSCTSPNTTIRFYFDEVLDDCFTYLYEGCGGGRNTFYEEALCRQTCIPADKHGCAGNKEPTGGCTDTDQTCPAGSTCFSGPFGVGPCCDDANEKEWDEARNPSCKVGELLMRNVFYGITPWLGKSCSHRFCPFGYDCIQGKRFAHCCGPIPNFTEKIYSETEDSSGGTSTYPKNNPPPLMSILSTNNAHGNRDDKKNSQTGRREERMKCEMGSALYRTGSKVLIGKSCYPRFCPDGYECIKGREDAYCCGSLENSVKHGESPNGYRRYRRTPQSSKSESKSSSSSASSSEETSENQVNEYSR